MKLSQLVQLLHFLIQQLHHIYLVLDFSIQQHQVQCHLIMYIEYLYDVLVHDHMTQLLVQKLDHPKILIVVLYVHKYQFDVQQILILIIAGYYHPNTLTETGVSRNIQDKVRYTRKSLLYNTIVNHINMTSVSPTTYELTTPGLLLFSAAGNGANRVPFPAV